MFPEQKLFKKIQIELCCLLRYLVLARFHVDFEEKAVPECIATNSNYLLLGRQEGMSKFNSCRILSSEIPSSDIFLKAA